MRHPLFVLLLTTLLLAACDRQGADSPAAATPAAPVALIDGKPVSAELFAFYAKNRAGKPLAELTAEEKQQLLDELIQIQVTAQAAEKNGLDRKDPDVAARLQFERLNVLANAAFQAHLGDKTPTEQELRAEYETQVAAQPRLEYRARHILVATEAFANNLTEQLKKGANFADLARRHSMDGSKEQGGDLNWFKPNQMVKPFADAVMALEKGTFTEAPVKSEFGWHVIKLEDTREVAPPDFEQVKDGLQRLVQQKKVTAYMDGLKKAASIEKKLVDEAKPAAAPAETPRTEG